MDSNLQQYNGTPTFPSRTNVNTNADPFLIPTPGPIVTSDGNGINQAPVNRSLRQIRDWIVGLRGAIVGDFAGAVQKTLKSLQIDGAGGVTATAAAGTIATSGDILGGGQAIINNLISSSNGDVQSVFGALIAGVVATPAYASLQRGLLIFRGTIATVSNPANGTAIPNQLRAVNTPKVWGLVGTTAVGPAVNLTEGIGYSAVYNGIAGGTIDVTFTTTMDDANYAVMASLNNEIFGGNVIVYVINKATTGFTLKGANAGGQQSFGSQTSLIGFVVFGRQTT